MAPRREPTFEELYRQISRKRCGASTFVDKEFLRASGLYDRVSRLLEGAGWPGLLTIHSETDVEDVREFLASFHYVGRADHLDVRYRHRGQHYVTYPPQLRELFGWQVDNRNWALRSSQLGDTWCALSSEPVYNPSASMARALREPAYFYLQKLLSGSVFGRDNGGDKVPLFELQVFQSCHTQSPLDFLDVLSKFWRKRLSCGAIYCGGLITYMLRRLHGQPVLDTHHLIPPTFLTREAFIGMRAITARPRRPDQFAWTYHVDPRLHEPLPIDRRRRRPVATEQAESSAAGARRAARDGEQPPSAFTQAQLDAAFNAYRVLDYLLPPGTQPVPAPPGWIPGQPIPPEYMIARAPPSSSSGPTDSSAEF